MAKRRHLFGKKRGERRSVPRWMGPAGEIAFFAALLLAAVAASGYLLVDYLLPEWWANRNFVESTCQVIDVRVGENRQKRGSHTRVEDTRRFRPEIQIKYITDDSVRGPTWTYDARFAYEYDEKTAQEIIAEFQPTQHYACWYDPINPARVVVVKSLSAWSWLLLLVPTTVAAFGGYKLTRTVLLLSLSPERRAHALSVPPAGKRGDKPQRPASERNRRAKRFPAIPAIEDIVNSPGTHLAYRLPSDSTGGWRIGGRIGLAVFFGAVLVTLLSHAVSAGLAESLFIIPFVAVAVGLTKYAVQEWLKHVRCGSSRLEVSDHPFVPGETYHLMLVQAGKMKLRRLDVQLICQEEATFSHGTDTRTAREVVYRDVLLRKDFLEIRPEAALEDSCDLYVPEDAMHSFVAEHNRVDWFLLVRLRSASGGFDRRFPVCVYPCVQPAAGRIRRTSPSSL